MGAWAVRFRVAAAACCGAVVVLVLSGLVAGIAFTLPSQAPSVATPRGFAAVSRAQTLFSGTNLFTALLLVVALLLVSVSHIEGDDAAPDRQERAILRSTVLLALLVAIGAVALGATQIWYVSVSSETSTVAQLASRLGGPISAAFVAAAVAWWSRAEAGRS